MAERLQKILAEAGLGSRRECERIIVAGRVTVDGKRVVTLGTTVDAEESEIRCDGSLIRKQRKIYFLLNKPKGYVCTNRDELERLKAIDIIKNVTQRIYTIGRLDKESEGLIIVTNDGDFANKLSHPKYEISKTYFVEVDGYLTDAAIGALESGIWLSFGKTQPVRIRNVHRGKQRSRFEMVLKEGKNREIRRMLVDCNYKVRILRRIKIGNLYDPSLKIGKYRKLTDNELARLYALSERGCARRSNIRGSLSHQKV
ncbi:MAG: rRNA pseudouridine synthase [Candidatus Brocadia sp.]|nr:rRNA pseudouridine synthase [Candidatus Brocadia sp.]MDG6027609.1 rRNA pseudouridine synthase [Candidatus Brocadia sp.]